ncbi:hypothetical protein H5410_020814 [Solanum commersonii]|uniref:Uncharacterized protein n=1 Tax=Solanum commersonii TaxID=4109 RepID=A0A9J5ZAZ7_SOLCO|nr:hypothetical protein H5410_020814 [Solanum commersonii]
MTEAFKEFDMFQNLDGFESDSDEDEIIVDLNLMSINLEIITSQRTIHNSRNH